MKTEKQVIPIRRRGRQWLLAVGVLLVGGVAVTSCSDKYDLDERTPDGWGASIYSWLSDEGNYTNTVRLIEDLGYREVLAKTGSKTLFVADDAAYERFYQNNPWGVRSYDQLSLSQKKLLLRGSMMDNSMQLNTLPSVEGNPPLEGQAMRRYSSTSPYDSVPIFTRDDMPDNPYWAYYRQQNKPMVCMTDNSDVTLLQFIEKQLVNNKITNDDYNFLYNYTTQRQPGDASINGVQVANPNVKCSNGFIHVMSDVITPLPNMAEVIRQKSTVSEYNKLLERFCAPYPADANPKQDGSVTSTYNQQYGTNVDTVFQKRFFSEKSQNGAAVNLSPKRGPVPGLLLYDPGWNSYYTGLNDQAGNIVLQRDMAVMMVPSNKALEEYWNNGAGKVLRDYYGSWDEVPDDKIVPLINNNMLTSFVSSVPSKFGSILNKDNDPMGIDINDIDSVWLGCNGAVYMTNRVYSPNDYVSVSFPALINETMKILYWGIEQCQYKVYLNSLNAYYSFFIPTNNAMLEYIDPCSYGMSRTRLFRFHYDSTKANEQDKVWASMWYYDPATGEVGDSIPEPVDYNMIRNRMKDIIETHLVIGDVEDGHEYYRTKAGTELRVKNVSAGAAGMTVEGSFQTNEGQPLRVTEVYDQSDGGNGKTYILDGSPIMGTRKSVYDVLSEHDEFRAFRELLLGSGILETKHNNRNSTASQNISSFNTYHYTVYVPTNESIEALQRAGKLSSWEKVEEYENAGNMSAKTRDSLQITEFVKYHIQDYALFIGAQPDEDDYETAAIDPSTERFYRLTAKLTDTGIELTDKASKDGRKGVSAHVLTNNPSLYNLVAREYQYDSSNAQSARNLETTSSAVIHLIDNPLLIK